MLVKPILCLFVFLLVFNLHADESCESNSLSGTPPCFNTLSQMDFNTMSTEYFNLAMGNDPAGTAALRVEIEQAMTNGSSCSDSLSCSDYSYDVTTNLGFGWTRRDTIESRDITDAIDGSVSCAFFAETLIKKDNFRARGVIGKSGRLSYTFGDYACSPASYEIERSLSLSEAGILVVDFSMVPRQFPGRWLLLDKKRTPIFTPVSETSAQFLLANDVYINIDNEGNVTGSNLLDTSMFDPEQCETDISRNGSRITPEIDYVSSSARRAYIVDTILDFGGVSQEEELNEHLNSIPRQDLP